MVQGPVHSFLAVGSLYLNPRNILEFRVGSREGDGVADWYLNNIQLLNNDDLGNVGTSCGSYADYPDPISVTTSANISNYKIGGQNTVFIYKQTGSWYILEGTNAMIHVKVTYTTNAPPKINANQTYPSLADVGDPLIINANVTDADDNLAWVNFTLISPSGANAIDNENGTNYNNDLWNSSSFTINESGLWNASIVLGDVDGE